MKKEDIEKLIGGYASGSLTLEERRLLFEAALEDQQLFDALQDELALKEVLDDPVSREQIHQAAAESLPRPKISWFRQPWTWAAGASLAAAAAALLIVLAPWNRTYYDVNVKQVAAIQQPAQPPAPLRDEKAQPAPSPKPAEPMARRMTAKKESAASPAKPATPAPAFTPPPAAPQNAPAREKDTVALAVPPPVPVQSETRAQNANGIVSQSQAVPGPYPQARQQAAQSQEPPRPVAEYRSQMKAKQAAATGRSVAGGAVAGVAALTPQFRDSGEYSLARRQEDGAYTNVAANTVFHAEDRIRLTIMPRTSGPLEVWELAPVSRRLFPPEGETAPVRAFERYTVPIDIVIRNGERLRFTVGSMQVEVPIDVR